MKKKDQYEGLFVISDQDSKKTAKTKTQSGNPSGFKMPDFKMPEFKIKHVSRQEPDRFVRSSGNTTTKTKKPKNRKAKTSRGSEGKPKTQKTLSIILALSVVLLFLVIIGVAYFTGATKAASDAKILKSSIKQSVTYLKNGDADNADLCISEAEKAIINLRIDLNESKWKVATHIPFAGKNIKEDLDTAAKAVDIADEATQNILKPAASYIRQTGKISLDGISIDKMGPETAAQLYPICDLIDEVGPSAEKVSNDLAALPLFHTGMLENQLASYRDMNQLAQTLIPAAESASTDILRPAADVMTTVSFSDLKTESGLDTNVLRAYLALENTVEPYIVDICDQVLTNPVFQSNPDQYKDLNTTLVHLMSIIYEVDTYKPFINLLIGNGEDRTFVVVAQNSAEMRACGGFPGSIGVATVRDGIFEFGDFQSVKNVLPDYHAEGIEISDIENDMFLSTWYGNNPRRASCNPHFPRAAELWAASYEEYNEVPVDGVISLTPHIIQRLLAVTGPVTLSNGKTIDSTNALEYLQRQIYIDYFSSLGNTEANDITDSLFAETADTVYKKLFENINKDSLLQLLAIVEESSEDRVFMMWMKDPVSQSIIENIGMDGALNSDPTAPEVAVFFSVNDANKLGPYMDYRVSLGTGLKNADGTITYPVTVTITNTIDDETLRIGEGNDYILANVYGGSMNTLPYFFAPAGGTISNIQNDAGIEITVDTYDDLQVGYNRGFLIDPGVTYTFTFDVTTAKGVTLKPKIITQPLIANAST